MIRLAFSTLGCPSWPLARILDAASRMGYDGVELRFVEDDDALWARPELTGSGLRETQARLADAGLAVPCVDTRSFFHSPDPAARRVAVEEAQRTAEVAAALGARGIRVFGDRVQPGADLASTRAWIVASLAELRDRLRGSGVEVWLETHGDFATAAATRSLLEEAGSDGLGAVWDPANAFSEFGEEPEAGAATLGPFVRHVHLKDARRAPVGQVPWPPALPGRGAFPAARVIDTLRAAGGERWVSFEWEKRWHPEIEAPEVALPFFLRWAADELRGRHATERTGARVLSCGRLRVEVFPSRPMLGLAAARTVAEAIRGLVARDGRAAVIFASAPSQNEFLAALRQEDRDRLAEAHRVPPRRVRRDCSPTTRPPSAASSWTDSSRTSRLRRFTASTARRPTSPRSAPAMRPCYDKPPRRSPSSGSARTATSPSSTRRSATSPSGRTCAWWSSTSRAGGSR